MMFACFEQGPEDSDFEWVTCPYLTSKEIFALTL